MKFKLSWHEENLKSFLIFLSGKFEERQKLDVELGRLKDELLFRRHQINEAKRQGKVDFDPEKFCIKRAKKGAL